jgi:hypothetical protein
MFVKFMSAYYSLYMMVTSVSADFMKAVMLEVSIYMY